ncbi:putative cobaltochelatase [Methanosarcina sp. KYL-1]|uniref:putative cobaltochelatase n=1 Tax=Methanosarcina sp. KYL-1 TaxID=2602068 RepID=UPI00210184F6|nr:putative cobaltochelatase [Methanosarcina sp. KYL-1]MCQ1535801.1 putative cobaltochelatase [Methanosarcina sp. KYL-1]
MNVPEASIYPFTAIVGQEQMKKSLVLNVINPKIGGVLIRGEKGTAKSTAVRALVSLLPEIEVVEGCSFGCSPHNKNEMCEACLEKTGRGELKGVLRNMRVVNLPVSATEDRVVGTLDLEHAIQTGKKRFEPGVLALAHRGILYVDEINLLDDHLVDTLLDAAAMGVNTVEREGISFSHPAAFVLVGTMNPEEGDLRPQLLDRFGLCADVKGIEDPEARVELLRRRLSYEQDPEAFAMEWAISEADLCSRILRAKALLSETRISDPMLELIAGICVDTGVDGHRADICMVKTSLTLAAFGGRTEVSEADVLEAAELVLSHRKRRKPFDDSSGEDKLEESLQKHRKKQEEKKAGNEEKESERQNPERGQKEGQKNEPEQGQGREPEESREEEKNENSHAGHEQVFGMGDCFRATNLSPEFRKKSRKGAGKRSDTRTEAGRGRYVKSAVPEGRVTDLAFDATLRAAAPYQPERKLLSENGNAVLLRVPDLRKKVREKKIGNMILFVVDASGSMGARQRMVAAKGAVLSLLLDAYQKRDRVGLIAFRGDSAELLLPPTRSVERARKCLQEMPTGGKTPLSLGLARSYEVIRAEICRDADVCPFMILISDGKANVSAGGKSPFLETEIIASRFREEGIPSAVIDTEKGALRFGLAKKISSALGGLYMGLEELRADTLLGAVRVAGGF